MHPQRLFQNLLHVLVGIQGGIGVLKDDLHPLVIGQQILAPGVGDILTVKEDLSVRGVVHTDQRSAKGGFPAAGFSHQAKALALSDVEGDAVNSLDKTLAAAQKVAHGKVLFQILCLQ